MPTHRPRPACRSCRGPMRPVGRAAIQAAPATSVVYYECRPCSLREPLLLDRDGHALDGLDVANPLCADVSRPSRSAASIGPIDKIPSIKSHR